jgi:DNA-binding MarR family transcriptional regulator
MRERVPTLAEQLRELSEECPWLDPGEQGEALQIHQFPTFVILRLATMARNHLTRRYLDPYGITLPEWRLLALLARFGTMRFSEVTAGSSMDKGQVSRTLKAIHGKGLVRLDALASVERSRNAAISPRIQVVISPKGRSLFNRILPIAQAQQAKVLEALTLEERRMFYAASLRILQALQDLGQEDPGERLDEDEEAAESEAEEEEAEALAQAGLQPAPVEEEA